MSATGLRARLRQALVPAAALVLLLAALYLAADAEGLGTGYARFYPYVFLIAGIALGLLALAILQRLLWLRRQLRRHEPGARLTRRLVLLLVLIAVPPVVLVYGFGLQFVFSTVDSWFRANTAQAMQDALALARTQLDARLDDARRATDAIAPALTEPAGLMLDLQLDAALDDSGAVQLAVLDEGLRVLGSAAARTDLLDVERPQDNAVLALEGRDARASTEPAGDGLRIRVLQRIDGAPGERRVLQALFDVPAAEAALARAVEGHAHAYGQARFLRESLKIAFALILTFVLLLSLLLALLLAFELARRMVRPIGQLARATEAVAAGERAGAVPAGGDDELGFLVESFNRMVRDLEAAQAAERASAAEIEAQRAQLHGVLARLSSGVLALDRHGRLRTVNRAAEAILGHALDMLLGRDADGIAQALPELAPLAAALRRGLAQPLIDWREELRLERSDGQLRLILRGARLPDGGVVLVFDDSAELDRAQRDAAWGEVARRLAHEIKNPLTPIQLAAERLRRRLLPRLDGDDADVLDRATHTVVAQVDALKAMVNAFSDYARPPPLKREPLDLAVLVRDVLELYLQQPHIALQLDIAPALPRVQADAGRLRQVLHNLLKNAVEAGEGRSRIGVSVRLAPARQDGLDGVELCVTDDGPGFPPDFDPDWFEPYRSTKQRGTGLGLAIVRRIVDEHGGVLRAANAEGGGAMVRVWLPPAAAGEGVVCA